MSPNYTHCFVCCDSLLLGIVYKTITINNILFPICHDISNLPIATYSTTTMINIYHYIVLQHNFNQYQKQFYCVAHSVLRNFQLLYSTGVRIKRPVGVKNKCYWLWKHLPCPFSGRNKVTVCFEIGKIVAPDI